MSSRVLCVLHLFWVSLILLLSVSSLAQGLFPLPERFHEDLRRNVLRIDRAPPRVGARVKAQVASWWRKHKDKKDNPCLLRYVWGHGSDTRSIVEKFNDDSYVGMGCGIGRLGSVPGAFEQVGSNGGWYWRLDPESNGYMNPSLTVEGAQTRKTNPNLFLKFEAEEISKQTGLVPSDKDFQDKGIRQVTSVGFMRLATYNWYAILNQARNRIKNNCSEVGINFICSSASSGGYDTKGWHGRIEDARRAKIFLCKPAGLDFQIA